VAAQHDWLRLDGGDVDVLLAAVDLMLALAGLSDARPGRRTGQP
jgi:hypothetical protein